MSYKFILIYARTRQDLLLQEVLGWSSSPASTYWEWKKIMQKAYMKLPICTRILWKRDRLFFTVTHGQKAKKQRAEIEMGEVLTGYKERIFHPKDSQTVKKDAQKGCAISPSLENFKTRLDKGLGNQVWSHTAPAFALSRRLN